MTRTTDTGTEDDSTEKISLRKKNDMYNRLKLMDKYPNSIYVSIHLNKFTTSIPIASLFQYFGYKNIC